MKKQRQEQLSSASEFQKGLRWVSKPCPAQEQSGGQPSKCENLNYISMGYSGESVSQSPLKDQAFSTFLDQKPPVEPRPEKGIFGSAKACSASRLIRITMPSSDWRIAAAPTSLFAMMATSAHHRPWHYESRFARQLGAWAIQSRLAAVVFPNQVVKSHGDQKHLALHHIASGQIKKATSRQGKTLPVRRARRGEWRHAHRADPRGYPKRNATRGSRRIRVFIDARIPSHFLCGALRPRGGPRQPWHRRRSRKPEPGPSSSCAVLALPLLFLC